MKIKICGIRSVAMAEVCVDAGATAIGLNFWRHSKRFCDGASAKEIVDKVAGRVRIVGVFVDAPIAEIRARQAAAGFSWVQLHGNEEPKLLAELLPCAYRAFRVRGVGDMAPIDRFDPMAELLLDSKVDGEPGGSGTKFDWSLAAALARSRKLWLAGGLTPENVGSAVAEVRPYGVDVASGVESEPGKKDAAKIRAFIQAAREA